MRKTNIFTLFTLETSNFLLCHLALWLWPLAHLFTTGGIALGQILKTLIRKRSREWYLRSINYLTTQGLFILILNMLEYTLPCKLVTVFLESLPLYSFGSCYLFDFSFLTAIQIDQGDAPVDQTGPSTEKVQV